MAWHECDFRKCVKPNGDGSCPAIDGCAELKKYGPAKEQEDEAAKLKKDMVLLQTRLTELEDEKRNPPVEAPVKKPVSTMSGSENKPTKPAKKGK